MESRAWLSAWIGSTPSAMSAGLECGFTLVPQLPHLVGTGASGAKDWESTRGMAGVAAYLSPPWNLITGNNSL